MCFLAFFAVVRITISLMKFATLALVCSFMGSATCAQVPAAPAATSATVPASRVITVRAKDQPPFTLALSDKLNKGAEFSYRARKVSVGEQTVTLQDSVTLSVKQGDKVLWSLSVPEGTITLPYKNSHPTPQDPR